MSWFKRKTSNLEAEQAKLISGRITLLADNIKKKLSQYQEASEPAIALFADVYQQNQISKIHRGLNGAHK